CRLAIVVYEPAKAQFPPVQATGVPTTSKPGPPKPKPIVTPGGEEVSGGRTADCSLHDPLERVSITPVELVGLVVDERPKEEHEPGHEQDTAASTVLLEGSKLPGPCEADQDPPESVSMSGESLLVALLVKEPTATHEEADGQSIPTSGPLLGVAALGGRGRLVGVAVPPVSVSTKGRVLRLAVS
ncbi:MAG: hypothetical protein JO368_01265, partial [Acidimicrobiales bacterium]|nr:hypothetical protein [Acidimicrobiales bacterium]